LSSETTEGIFVSWRFGDFQHHFVAFQFRRQVVVVAEATRGTQVAARCLAKLKQKTNVVVVVVAAVVMDRPT
jgi:hypothetical protein